ncbi:hypothetical protein [Streptomyces sp.]|uniref:hypothetical protein n=1 Tax=Streptomyces sp. TaxID=1931 RepID=UPI002F409DF8
MTAEPERTAAREPRNVPGLLARMRQERFTGAVTVEGGPGGRLFLRDGLVSAVETPAAPTARSVLLKSGRIAVGDWDAALAAVPHAGALAGALADRGLISAGELHIVCTAAVYDGAFAMALQPVSGWRIDPGRTPELAAWPGQDPSRLTEETARRLRTLRERWPSVAEFARTPLHATARPNARTLDVRRGELLHAVDGRRTPRDLAFVLGRGVYPVMLDLTWLDTRRLVSGGRPAPHPAGPLLTARTAAGPPPPPPPGSGSAPLPRRTPGAGMPSGPAVAGGVRSATDAGAPATADDPRRLPGGLPAPAARPDTTQGPTRDPDLSAQQNPSRVVRGDENATSPEETAI